MTVDSGDDAVVVVVVVMMMMMISLFLSHLWIAVGSGSAVELAVVVVFS